MAQIILLTDIASNFIGYGKYAGTYKIASEIRKHNYSCQVIDNYTFLGYERLTLLMEKFVDSSTIMIGISCSLNEKRTKDKTFHWGIDDEKFSLLIDFIKNINPNIKIVSGGPRAKFRPDWKFVDYTLLGKADNSIIALIDHLTLNKDLKFKQLNYTKLVEDSDYPYSQQEFENSVIQYETNDIIFPNEALPIEFARGCIFKCSFCKYDLIGKKSWEWTKNAKTIRSEMIRNYEMFGTVHYNVSDELINESIDKLKMIHEVTTSLPFKVEYTGYARIDLIWRYPEMRELLLESGAKCLLFGLETFHEHAGKSIGKGLGPEKVKETLHYCRNLWKGKVLMTANFIIGLPYEPEENVLSTLEYLLSDNGPLDIWSYTVLDFEIENIKNYSGVSEKINGVSKIEANPKKYGISVDTTTHNWEGTHLTKSQATDLLKKIEANVEYRKILSFCRFKWFGRAISLGYSIEDVFDILKNKKSIDTAAMLSKSYFLRKQYFNSLMNL